MRPSYDDLVVLPVETLVERLIDIRVLLDDAFSKFQAEGRRANKAEEELREAHAQCRALKTSSLNYFNGMINAESETTKAQGDASCYKLKLQHTEHDL